MTSSASAPTPLPADAIQRVLFIASTVHIYNIPPLTSNKGYTASTWTADNSKRQIFTGRLRIIETAIPLPKDAGESLSTDILLEDPSTGELFAKAPYTDAEAVEAVLDSSHFFAIRVVGDGGMKATLGIGFAERGVAIDFGICLQECRKVLGVETASEKKSAAKTKAKSEVEVKKDYGLKEGQTIMVDIGRKGRNKAGADDAGAEEGGVAENALFSIKPPPGPSEKGGGGGGGGGEAMPMLAPPPSAQDVRSEKRRSRGFEPVEKTAAELGFDDGEFGEFQ